LSWTGDCYVDNYSGAPADGSPRVVNDCSLHVLRGGAWNYNPRYLRVAYRNGYGDANYFVGFRLARTE
jgi:formylglycine-generating enzyme required for sulfatase activity